MAGRIIFLRSRLFAICVVCLVAVVAAAACGSNESEAESTSRARDSLAAIIDPPPRPGPVAAVGSPPDSDWNWQLTGQLDTSVDARVWDIDLFETTSEEIERLHAADRYVICYFSAGTSEDWRPDFGDIDAEIIGEPLDDWPGERWLDIRSSAAFQLVNSRLGLAKEKGCDAVEPDNVDGYTQQTGFPLSETDQVLFNAAVARSAHRMDLAVGLKNAYDLIEILAPIFDFAVTEQCHEYEECELLKPFLELDKQVFNAEYPDDRASAREVRYDYCAEADQLGIYTLILPIDLDGSWRISCDD